ncbi:MAG: flagellar protein FlaG [Bdellovibrionota bacterium]
MSSSEVNAVSSEGLILQQAPAALPSAVGVSNPVAPAANPNRESSDAVTVEVSGAAGEKPAVQGQVAAAEKQAPNEKSFDSAKAVAENLRKVFDQIRSTQVSFDVSIQESGASTLSFQVIDTKSGEVVREFPPEIAKSLNNLDEARTRGLLVEESA